MVGQAFSFVQRSVNNLLQGRALFDITFGRLTTNWDSNFVTLVTAITPRILLLY